MEALSNSKNLKHSFFERRMNALGVTPSNNQITLINPEGEFPFSQPQKVNIFEETNQGNIKINFYTLHRELITYYKKGKGKMSAHNQKIQTYCQIRVRDPQNGNKYLLPKGQGSFPFIPPALVKAWEEKASIQTLVLTEGVFKAWKACLLGVMTVGLTSITHYRNAETQELHQDIQTILVDCKVKNVVILWDADCLQISEKQLRDQQDITKRPRGFFNAAKNIRKLALQISGMDNLEVFFYQVKEDCFDTFPKGLDDLLIAAVAQNLGSAVVKELLKLETDRRFYFIKFCITKTTALLYQYFHLQDVQSFYHFHAATIKNKVFNFDNNFWQWQDAASKLELKTPDWATSIKWIGDGFHKVLLVPDAQGELRQELHQRSKQTLSDLHGKNFQKYLKYFEGFCNVPNHLNYQSEYGDFYNLYAPFEHQAAAGDCLTTLAFLKHIFGEETILFQDKTYSSFELGLDYLQLLITKPTQCLPVLILFSQENNTGKSTFGKWEKYLFGHNAVQVGNHDFKSEFNEHWTNKLLVICEETLLDRKKDVEQIKAYTTSSRITVNPKGMKKFEIDFFCKFQFFSNNRRMIYINKYDERFWIREVPVPKSDNPNLLEELKKEVPAFLDLIFNRQLSTTTTSRMHFSSDLIRTTLFNETVKINEPTDATNLREKIKMMFLDFDLTEILLPLKSINLEFFQGKAKIPWLKELLHDYLEVDKLRDANTGKVKQVRGQYFRWEVSTDQAGDEILKKRVIKFNDRPYVFSREKFVFGDDEFIKELFDDTATSSKTTK